MSGPPGENCGAFVVPYRGLGLLIIVANGLGWELVSFHLPDGALRWEMVAFVKPFFWGPEARVIEYHPPASLHKNFLHLLRPIDVEICDA